MAVAAWAFYDQFKRFMGDNTIDMDGATFDLHLFRGSSNASTKTLSTLSQLTSQVTSANGYSQSGKAMTVTWSTGVSTGEMRFDATSVVWSASGGSISAIQFAVIVARTGASGKDGTNKIVAWSKLSTGVFSISDGNTLTITPNATNGIFELNG